MTETNIEDLPIKFFVGRSNKAIFIYAAIGAAIGVGAYLNESFWKQRLITGVNLALDAERNSPKGLF